MPNLFLLVALGVLTRIIPHPPNAVALGAIALYAGARMPFRLAVIAPMLAMILSDAILDFGVSRPILAGDRVVIYATYIAIVAIGGLLKTRRNLLGSISVAALCSLLFFVATNLAVWAFEDSYPKSLAGLSLCYQAALPFLGNTIAADFVGAISLFGGERLVAILAAKRRAGEPRAID